MNARSICCVLLSAQGIHVSTASLKIELDKDQRKFCLVHKGTNTWSQSKEKCKARSEAQIECFFDALLYFHDT